ncbi:MAG: tetratricopeptide repeat protein [bacterium]
MGRFTWLAGAVFSGVILISCGAAGGSEESIRLNNEGTELFERGNLEQALEKFKEAVKLAPDNPEIRANLGYVYQTLRRYPEAEQELKRAIALAPDNTDAHNNLGITYYYQGKTEQALAEWELILRLDPGNGAAAANVNLARGGAPAFTPERRDAAAPGPPLERPPDARILFSRAKEVFLKGDYRLAAGLLEDVLEIKPASLFSRYYLGLAYGYLGDAQKAIAHLREYLVGETYPPQSAAAYENAKAAFHSLRKDGKMPPVGVTTGGGAAGVSFAKGKDAFRKRDFFRAIHFLKEAVRLKPDSFESNYYLGLAYREVGDREGAVFHLTKCLLRAPRGKRGDGVSGILKELKAILD